MKVFALKSCVGCNGMHSSQLDLVLQNLWSCSGVIWISHPGKDVPFQNVWIACYLMESVWLWPWLAISAQLSPKRELCHAVFYHSCFWKFLPSSDRIYASTMALVFQQSLMANGRAPAGKILSTSRSFSCKVKCIECTLQGWLHSSKRSLIFFFSWSVLSFCLQWSVVEILKTFRISLAEHLAFC